MTTATPTAWQLYATLAPSWTEAGANPFDFVETMLEMLAGAKLHPKPDGNLVGELTLRSWENVREDLTVDLNLPKPRGDARKFWERVPGLLELTRRSLSPVFPILSSKKGEAFARALLQFLVYAPQTGMRRTPLGEFKVPEYLAPLLCRLLGDPDKDALYCPFDSSGWMPLLLAEAGWSVDCELKNAQAARVLLLFAFVGNWKLKAHVADPIREPSWLDGAQLRRFEHSAAITNFGLRLKDESYQDPFQRFPAQFHYGEALQVAHLLAQTRGLSVVVVPESLLFRTAGSERDYKEQLTRRGVVSSVIRLPRNAFAPAANVQSSILALDTKGSKYRDVLFVDASEELSRANGLAGQANRSAQAIARIAAIVAERSQTTCSALAGYEEIAAQDFNISVDRYVRSEKEQLIANVLERSNASELIDVAEIIRPQTISDETSNRGRRFAEISLQDIEPDGSIQRPSKEVSVGDQNRSRAMRQRVQPGDVLLSVRGRIGAVAMVPDSAVDWLAGQAFVILRLRDTSPITPLVLYRYLSSPLGQGVLQSLESGTTVPMISMGDIKKLRILVPTVEEQCEIEKHHEETKKVREKIRGLEELAEALNSRGWPMTKIATPESSSKAG